MKRYFLLAVFLTLLQACVPKMVIDTKGAEFRVVHKNHAELAYVTSTITEVEVVTE